MTAIYTLIVAWSVPAGLFPQWILLWLAALTFSVWVLSKVERTV